MRDGVVGRSVAGSWFLVLGALLVTWLVVRPTTYARAPAATLTASTVEVVADEQVSALPSVSTPGRTAATTDPAPARIVHRREPLTEQKRAELRQTVGRLATAHQNSIWRYGASDTPEDYVQYAAALCTLELTRAAIAMLDAGSDAPFLTTDPPDNTGDWYYYNMRQRPEPGGPRWAIFPFELATLPSLAAAVRFRTDARAFVAHQRAAEWNARPFEERKAAYEQAQRDAAGMTELLRMWEDHQAGKSVAVSAAELDAELHTLMARPWRGPGPISPTNFLVEPRARSHR